MGGLCLPAGARIPLVKVDGRGQSGSIGLPRWRTASMRLLHCSRTRHKLQKLHAATIGEGARLVAGVDCR